MKNIVSCGDKEYQLITFDWEFVDSCNYACSYCAAADWMKPKFTKSSSPAKHKIVLARLSQVRTPFALELQGGEPTLHPHLFDVVSEAIQMEFCKTVDITTNLSRPLSFYKRFDVPLYKGLELTASYHPEYATDAYVEKCVAISQFQFPKFSINFNVPDKKEHWDRALEVIEIFREHNIKHTLNLIFATDFYTPEYTKEGLALFEPYIQETALDEVPFHFSDGSTELLTEPEILRQKLDRFKGWKCAALMFTIQPNGTIYNTCTGEEMPMGLTNERLFRTVTCPMHHCPCDTMYYFYKEPQ